MSASPKESCAGEPTSVALLDSLEEARPHRAEVERVPLVVIRLGPDVHVLYGRCPHRAADLACATVEGSELVCQEHGWGFELATGASPGLSGVAIHRFDAWVDEASGEVLVDAAEIRVFREEQRDAFVYEL